LKALAESGSYAVVICDHYIGMRSTFAIPLDCPVNRVLEIDLADGITWRGTYLLPAAELLMNSIWDERGFRRVPTGMEAAYQLTCNALRHGGGLERDIVGAKAIREKALDDFDIFQAVMLAMHGSPGELAARRFVRDEWQPSVGLLLTGHRILRAARYPLARPTAVARRKAMIHWREFPRRVEESPAAWLRRASRGHGFHLVGPPQGLDELLMSGGLDRKTRHPFK
jgi:hypothetical protein